MRNNNAFKWIAARAKWLLCLVLVLPSLPIAAQGPFQQVAEAARQQGSRPRTPGISLEQATATVRRRTGGRVLSAKPVGNRGYEVRVLVEGKRVKKVFVDNKGTLRDRSKKSR